MDLRGIVYRLVIRNLNKMKNQNIHLKKTKETIKKSNFWREKFVKHEFLIDDSLSF